MTTSKDVLQLSAYVAPGIDVAIEQKKSIFWEARYGSLHFCVLKEVFY